MTSREARSDACALGAGRGGQSVRGHRVPSTAVRSCQGNPALISIATPRSETTTHRRPTTMLRSGCHCISTVLIVPAVLMEALRAIQGAGAVVVRVDPEHTPTGPSYDAVVTIALGDVRARFVVETKARAPYPNELP